MSRKDNGFFQNLLGVQPLDRVDNSISPCELISGQFSPHLTVEIDGVLHPMDLCACACFHLHDAAYRSFTWRFLTSFTLNM